MRQSSRRLPSVRVSGEDRLLANRDLELYDATAYNRRGYWCRSRRTIRIWRQGGLRKPRGGSRSLLELRATEVYLVRECCSIVGPYPPLTARFAGDQHKAARVAQDDKFVVTNQVAYKPLRTSSLALWCSFSPGSQ